MTTSLRPDESLAFHRDRTTTGTTLTTSDRERFLSPYLPEPQPRSQSFPKSRFRRPHLRPLLKDLLHLAVFHLIQFIFTLYIHARRTYHALTFYFYSVLYYHHRSPELIRRDVRNVSRLPRHLSIIVALQSDGANEPAEGLEKLITDVAEASAWCVCAGIPMLSVYERTGALKTHMASLNTALQETMRSYFPPETAPRVQLRAPLQQGFSPGNSRSPSPPDPRDGAERDELDVLLLSASDGRATLVDLTKTLAEMAQKSKLAPADITTELIDAEVTESSCGEPDLLLVMAPSDTSSLGPRRRKRKRVSRPRQGLVNGEVQTTSAIYEETERFRGGGGDICLRGYPPWQARLTEIFHIKDGRGVDYQAFLRALHRYAKAQMRFGR